jgi:hypothetical protein
MANFATISGILKDTDGTAWHLATWTAVPVSPSSKPVFKDGTPVPVTSGTLDDTGAFSGQIPNTLAILPPGTTLTLTLTSMTSAPPLTLTKVQIVADTVDLGALLTPRTVAPRIKAGAIVYAYNTGEITNPVHGNGYINTYENQSYIFMQNSWVKIGASPDFDTITASGDANFNHGALFAGVPTWPTSDFKTRLGISASGNVGQLSVLDSGMGIPEFSVRLATADGVTQSVEVLHCTYQGAWTFNNSISAPKSIWAGEAFSAGPSDPVSAIGQRQYGCYLYVDKVNPIYTRLVGTGDGGSPGRVSIQGAQNGFDPINYATFDTAGLHVTGDISATTKTFKITHPLDESKLLIHSCLEGPENGVYYRGEAELSGGFAEVELPDYFEALTASDGRTVQLTQVFKTPPGERPIFSQLATSPVTDGKFAIYASERGASIFVSWEVKAVRRDVARLEVERAKPEPQAAEVITN